MCYMVNIRVRFKTGKTLNQNCLDSALGSFDPACELYLFICKQSGSNEDGVLAEYLRYMCNNHNIKTQDYNQKSG